MLHRVALVRTDVSEELRVTRIGELGTTLTITSNQSTLRRNTRYPTYGTLMSDTVLMQGKSSLELHY
jgi:hypothetical protein